METTRRTLEAGARPRRAGPSLTRGPTLRPGTSEQVLIVAADRIVTQAWRTELARSGFAVDEVSSLDQASARASQSGVALIVVDVMTDENGSIGLIQTLRDAGNPATILAVTRAGNSESVIDALEAGADGCIGHTSSAREFVARLRALVRRRRPGPRSDTVSWVVYDLRIDPTARCVFRNAQPIALARREFAVLLALLRRRGRAVSREAVLRDVWRRPPRPTPHSVDAIIRDLRRKLEPNQRSPRYILTVRSAGYLIPA
jgi:two-component system response regulator MtrA